MSLKFTQATSVWKQFEASNGLIGNRKKNDPDLSASKRKTNKLFQSFRTWITNYSQIVNIWMVKWQCEISTSRVAPTTFLGPTIGNRHCSTRFLTSQKLTHLPTPNSSSRTFHPKLLLKLEVVWLIQIRWVEECGASFVDPKQRCPKNQVISYHHDALLLGVRGCLTFENIRRIFHLVVSCA